MVNVGKYTSPMDPMGSYFLDTQLLQRSHSNDLPQVSRQNIHRAIHHGTAETQATQNLPHAGLQKMSCFEVGPYTVNVYIYICIYTSSVHSERETAFQTIFPTIVESIKNKVESQNSPQHNKSISKNVNEYVSKSGAQKFTYGLSGLQLKWKISRKFFWGGHHGSTNLQTHKKHTYTHLILSPESPNDPIVLKACWLWRPWVQPAPQEFQSYGLQKSTLCSNRKMQHWNIAIL